MLIHVANLFVTRENRDRVGRAQSTWRGADRYVLRQGYGRSLGGYPYIKDIVESSGASPSDTILITNNDTSLCSDWRGFVEVGKIGFSKRLSTNKAVRVGLDSVEARLRFSDWHQGVDAIFFTWEWWLANRSEYPDLVLGMEGWDWILRFMIGEEREVGPFLWHEDHGDPGWLQNRKSVPSLHNQRLCRQWAEGFGMAKLVRKWPSLLQYDFQKAAR